MTEASKEAVEVTQADREAAVRFLKSADLITLDRYEQSLVQAFARHRQSAERGEVVATAFSAVNIRGQTKTIASVDELLRLINGGAMLRDVRRITLPTPPEAA